MPSANPPIHRALQLLERTGAVKSGHFLLSSGLHSPNYCQCAALFEHPAVASEIAAILAAQFPVSLEIDAVLAPALGGILWGYELTRALAAARTNPVRSLFAERAPGQPFTLRRSFHLNPRDRVLLAEDVVTTGGSVMELVPLVESAGATVAAFAAVADRSKGGFKPAQPFFSLLQLDFPTYEPHACPHCAQGSTPTKPGSRAAPAPNPAPAR